MPDLEHEHQVEGEMEAGDEKDHRIDAIDTFGDHIEQVFLESVGEDLTNTAREDLPFEASQLATRFLRLAERCEGAEVPGVEPVIRGALSLLCAPRRSKRIAERVNDWLRGYDAGRISAGAK